MDQLFQALLARLDHFSDQFKELKEGFQRAVRIAGEDPEMALTRARKVLEYVVRDVYERRCQEPPGTRPLENLLQRLVKDGHFPPRLEAYANTVRMLGNVGTHRFGEKVTAADVYQSLTQLMSILEWYFEEERPEAIGRQSVPLQPPQLTRSGPAEQPPSSPPPLAIVPKGLRSFDASDSYFFLDLLPGPRDKDGLPESIRFWKHRIESTEELNFTVGVIYGPSGCGKSSLVKAGLLPRLAGRVLSVYVEATGEDTEARLLKGLHKRCPGLPRDLDLTGTIAALRQGQGCSKGQKVFVVLDQFEQWLHAQRGKEDAELVQALRQCDGERVQAVVTVRDDFLLAVSRFMGNLDIELDQRENFRLVDLFDPIHARDVLSKFGWAFGRLHEDLSKDEDAFLDQAVAGLSQENKIVCVRLALFVEMMKGRTWTPATLKEVGGTEGVGETFLEETFSSQTANPKHGLHQKAARGVLKALLPESGTNIMGHMRSHAELLEASGYASRPKDFADLMRILDSEICLITPTDPEGKKGADESNFQAQAGQKYYQLTHDYLVHSVRDWLTRKQKETRRGQAELLLADRAGVWNARPENRQLPSLLQWLQIRWLTQQKNWTPPQKKMMRKASRYHGVRGGVLAVFLAVMTLVALGIRELRRADHAAALVRQLLNADIGQVPNTIEEMRPYRFWTDSLLIEALSEAQTKQDARKQLHLSLALLPVDARQFDYLYERLLNAGPEELRVIRDALKGQQDTLVKRLQTVLVDSKENPGRRLKAACALAGCESAPNEEDDGRWRAAAPVVVNQLLTAVLKNPSHYVLLLELLRPSGDKLRNSLAEVYRSRERSESERAFAANFLAELASDQPEFLTDLLLDAGETQFAAVFEKLKEYEERAATLLLAELDKKQTTDATEVAKEKLAKSHANAGVALLRLGQATNVWPLLKHCSDPSVRSYLIDRFRPMGTEAVDLLAQLNKEPDVTIRRALLLSLGQYGPDILPSAEKAAWIAKITRMYQDDPDPGMHGAAEWLLRKWQQQLTIKQFTDEWAKDAKLQEQKQVQIREALARDRDKTGPQWYVNGQGQTMVVFPGPLEFWMGSPKSETERGTDEDLHPVRIGRTFSLAATSVTVDQFQRFLKANPETRRVFGGEASGYLSQYSPSPDCPIIASWYMAAQYCNWLSAQEGIDRKEWCYEPNGKGQYAEGMRLAANYLKRTGYRLPTEAEWEYACRAGAATRWYYGESAELLERYARYNTNSADHTWPVGGLKPNDRGLFDTHGNVWNWCINRYASYSKPPNGKPVENKEDDNDIKRITSIDGRVLRGGSFAYHAGIVRSAYRARGEPSNAGDDVGFRPARTFAAE